MEPPQSIEASRSNKPSGISKFKATVPDFFLPSSDNTTFAPRDLHCSIVTHKRLRLKFCDPYKIRCVYSYGGSQYTRSSFVARAIVCSKPECMNVVLRTRSRQASILSFTDTGEIAR